MAKLELIVLTESTAHLFCFQCDNRWLWYLFGHFDIGCERFHGRFQGGKLGFSCVTDLSLSLYPTLNSRITTFRNLQPYKLLILYPIVRTVNLFTDTERELIYDYLVVFCLMIFNNRALMWDHKLLILWLLWWSISDKGMGKRGLLNFPFERLKVNALKLYLYRFTLSYMLLDTVIPCQFKLRCLVVTWILCTDV